MATQTISLFALFSLSLAPERPPRTPPTPNGPQPEFATVRQVNPAQKTVIVLQTQVVMVPVSYSVNQDGQSIVKTVYRQEYRMIERAFALDKGIVTDAAGKKVSAAEALKRLKVGATVLLANQPVDPLYLRVIRPDALILVSDHAPPTTIPVSPPPVFPGFKDKRAEPPPKR